MHRLSHGVPTAGESITRLEFSMLHSVPEILDSINQADRTELYRALGLTVTYRRVDDIEEVRLRATLRPVDLEQVRAIRPERSMQVNHLNGVDLKRVGGAFTTLSTPQTSSSAPWTAEWSV